MRVVRTGFEFRDPDEAVALARFFFGAELGEAVRCGGAGGAGNQVDGPVLSLCARRGGPRQVEQQSSARFLLTSITPGANMSETNIPGPGREPDEQPADPPLPKREPIPAQPAQPAQPQPAQPEPAQPQPGGRQNNGNGAGGNGGGGNGDGKSDGPHGPGKSPASKGQIGCLGAILVGMMLLIFIIMIQVWPHPSPSTEVTTTRPDSVRQDSLRRDSVPRDSIRRDSIRRDSVRRAGDTSQVALTARTPAWKPELLLFALQARGPSGRQANETGRGAGESCEARETRIAAEFARNNKLNPGECVQILFFKVYLWDEQRLLILVMLGGALGSLLYALRSLGWYIGNRELVRSWIPRYLFVAFTGAALAVVFYVVVRGGFFSPGTTIEETSPFGFLAFAMLVGLFAEQAVLKLKKVAESLLEKPGEGKDAKPQDTDSAVPGPTISTVTREKDAGGAPTNSFTIRGSNFAQASEVFVGSNKQGSAFVSDKVLTFTMAQVPAPGSTITVVVRNPGDRVADLDLTL